MLTSDTYQLSKQTQQPIIISKKYHNYRLDLLMECKILLMGDSFVMET
jgi:hypothetical protein